MSKITHHEKIPAETLERLRQNLAAGASLLLEELTDEELQAMQQLLLAGEAEIISSACRPFVAAKLERGII